MPELPEIESFARYLRKKVIGRTVTEIDKRVTHKRYKAAIDNARASLPLRIVNVVARGKQIAIIFDQGALVFGMGTGAAFYVGSAAEKDESPLDYRRNVMLSLENGDAIFIVDCHTTQNQVSFEWKDSSESIFDTSRGPDILSEGLHEHITALLEDEKYNAYFEDATVFDALLNQSLFNGVGTYSSNEICFWLYRCAGIRPWANFKFMAQQRGLLIPLIDLVRKYFTFMLNYIDNRPYVPPIHYDEREWLSFRAIFLKVYKAKHVTLGQSNRVEVIRISVRLKSSVSFRITKGAASCFVPDFSEDEVLPAGWAVAAKQHSTIGPHNLAVGIYSWWGNVDKKKTLASPQKANIRCRPSTLASLTGLVAKNGTAQADNKGEDTETSKGQASTGRGSTRLSGRARKIHFLEKQLSGIFL